MDDKKNKEGRKEWTKSKETKMKRRKRRQEQARTRRIEGLTERWEERNKVTKFGEMREKRNREGKVAWTNTVKKN